MKKNLFFIAAGLITLLAINTKSKAQARSIAEGALQKKSAGYTADAATELKYAVVGNLKPVHTKAVRNFVKHFKTATNVTWFDATDGYRAVFEAAGIKTWVDYDKKGIWLHTIRTYDEKTLSREIRHQVKSIYYDHAIKLVHEIELPGIPQNTTCYIILLENETTLVELRLYDGEMDVLKEWVKK